MREYEVWMMDRETKDPTGILMISANSEAEAERKAEELRPGEAVAACEWTGASDGEEDESNGMSNFAQAEALAWEISDSTCQDMDLTLEIERRLDAGETVEAIREAYDTEEQRFVDPSTPEEPERDEIPYPQILEERIASLNARIADCRDDDERIALYQTREDLEEELRFAWAELEEEAEKPADLWTVDAFLAECEELCRNPYSYDFARMPAGTCNGHEVRGYPRSLAAVLVDGGVVNMGVINERYPRGSVGFFVNNKGMTGLEYVRYLLEK